jgi:hypothetical protein
MKEVRIKTTKITLTKEGAEGFILFSDKTKANFCFYDCAGDWVWEQWGNNLRYSVEHIEKLFNAFLAEKGGFAV